MTKRAPVIAVLGHVDHGKTTLLDNIRKSNVADREAGGITQTVGAYEIEHPSASSGQAEKITFIDTPGHAAFTGMRSRGASIADMAILVVAADDGVKPQTKEAIKILQDRKIPFVVAISKIDKNNADIDKTKSDLSQHGVLLEGFGGNISFQEISAKNGTGINELLDLLLLAAEMEEFKKDDSAPASGFVLEAKRDPRAGIIVTLIIKNGTLKQGEEINTETAKAKVKQLKDFQNKAAKSLSASSPAVILGFDELPKAGEMFAENVELKTKEEKEKIRPNENSVNLIIRADLAGTLEALSYSIKQLTPPEGKEINIVDEFVGTITDGDVNLAKSTGATIIAYNVKVEKAAEIAAKEKGIKIIGSKIIYKILEELEAIWEHQDKGGASGILEVLANFNHKNFHKQLIGGRVEEGEIKAKSKIEVKRGGKLLGTGKILSLQSGKTETGQVEAGSECGMIVNVDFEIEVGDKVLSKS